MIEQHTKNKYANQKRSAWVDAHQMFAMGTSRSGEPKVVQASKKRPGKLKWPTRAPIIQQKQPPGITQQQAKLISHHGMTPLQAALKERYAGFGQR